MQKKKRIRKMRRLLLVGIAFLLGTVGFVGKATEVSACSGGGFIAPRPDSNVFVGKVLEVRTSQLDIGYDVAFEVFKVEQGDVGAIMLVNTPPGYSCGVSFEVGGMYEVITLSNKSRPEASRTESDNMVLISTTHQLHLSAEEEELYDERESVKGKDLLERFFKRYDVSISINGVDVAATGPFDEVYSNKDNRVMLPLTDAFMSRLGIEYAFNDEEEQKVTLKYKSKEYVYHVGRDYVYFDGNHNEMDTVVERYYGMTFVPAQQVAAIIGGKATWDNKLKKLELSF
ncbi:stalk domain-containing protein [Paenibacillus sp. GCM10027626]|uniref:stalk domain-containing protein n=1 Tax=Paenibacillus sp. GCM10027626 TaxID=3273411 RepID=UPI00362D7793